MHAMQQPKLHTSSHPSTMAEADAPASKDKMMKPKGGEPSTKMWLVARLFRQVEETSSVKIPTKHCSINPYEQYPGFFTGFPKPAMNRASWWTLDKSLGSAANLSKLLPIGTTLAFRTMALAFTKGGECKGRDVINFWFTWGLISLLTLLCGLIGFLTLLCGQGPRHGQGRRHLLRVCHLDRLQALQPQAERAVPVPRRGGEKEADGEQEAEEAGLCCTLSSAPRFSWCSPSATVA
jgi:hypothetical protein